MQKDIHFYLTYALAIAARIAAEDAEIIAWADQYTDDLTVAELYGIQTQSAILGNWRDRQIQLSVLIPFHFIPGDDTNWPWMVTPNSNRAKMLVEKAIQLKSLMQLGIALHSLQDTFSHQGFTGWDEPFNACYPWYYLQSGIPNIGHAEMQAIPDIVNQVWTDPRNGNRIDNRDRAMECAKATFYYLCQSDGMPSQLSDYLAAIFRMNSYDERKNNLLMLADSGDIRYQKITEKYKRSFKSNFIWAANNHLAIILKSLQNSLILSGKLS